MRGDLVRKGSTFLLRRSLPSGQESPAVEIPKSPNPQLINSYFLRLFLCCITAIYNLFLLKVVFNSVTIMSPQSQRSRKQSVISGRVTKHIKPTKPTKTPAQPSKSLASKEPLTSTTSKPSASTAKHQGPLSENTPSQSKNRRVPSTIQPISSRFQSLSQRAQRRHVQEPEIEDQFEEADEVVYDKPRRASGSVSSFCRLLSCPSNSNDICLDRHYSWA